MRGVSFGRRWALSWAVALGAVGCSGAALAGLKETEPFVLDLMVLSESGGPWHSVGSARLKAPGLDAKVGTELALVEVGGKWARVSLGADGWVAELGCGSSTVAFKSTRVGVGNEQEQPTSRCQGEWLRARVSKDDRS